MIRLVWRCVYLIYEKEFDYDATLNLCKLYLSEIYHLVYNNLKSPPQFEPSHVPKSVLEG